MYTYILYDVCAIYFKLKAKCNHDLRLFWKDFAYYTIFLDEANARLFRRPSVSLEKPAPISPGSCKSQLLSSVMAGHQVEFESMKYQEIMKLDLRLAEHFRRLQPLKFTPSTLKPSI